MFFILIVFAAQLDLNRAGLEEFYNLPVDSAICQAIYRHRKTYGPFNSVYELLDIPGIDQKIFETIKPMVKIAVPFPARTEWGSIIAEQKKLASEEPPSKAAIDEWEDLLFSPININRAWFDDLLTIDRMTPIDCQGVIKAISQRNIKSSRDLRRINGLSYYSYVSLRRYVQYTDDTEKRMHGSVRLRLKTSNRFDTGEENENIAARISYLEQADKEIDNTIIDLKNYYAWSAEECEELRDQIDTSLKTLRNLRPSPAYSFRLKGNYERKLRLGIFYDLHDNFTKGYVGIANAGPIYRILLGNYRVVWAEGIMVDNTDEYRARIFSRSTGIFGDLTDNRNYAFTGVATSFFVPLVKELVTVKPSMFYSTATRDAIKNPDRTVWRQIQNYSYDYFKNQLNEQVLGVNCRLSPLEKINPGTHIAFEGMVLDYPEHRINPDPRWIDIPLDKYDPWFYPEITQLSTCSRRYYYGSEFLIPYKNLFVSGEYVIQKDTLNAKHSAYIVKSRIQYDYFYLNMLFRKYEIGYDNPFSRGFSEYRRFEDTPFEKPYALVNPEFISVYDDPAPKPEKGLFLETRYQITRNIILRRAYLDLFENLCHGLNNMRAYFEFEFQPLFPVHLRYSEKYVRKYLPRTVQPTLSQTIESSFQILFYLSNFDNLGIEYRNGNVLLTGSDAGDADLTGGFLNLSFEHNFLTGFSVEGGIVLWKTDGMSQWIFEDTGIDFLSDHGIKFYVVSSQKIGNMLMKLKFRKKQTFSEHNGLYNNPEIYYPDLPGARVDDFVNQENTIHLSLQLDYLF